MEDGNSAKNVDFVALSQTLDQMQRDYSGIGEIWQEIGPGILFLRELNKRHLLSSYVALAETTDPQGGHTFEQALRRSVTARVKQPSDPFDNDTHTGKPHHSRRSFILHSAFGGLAAGMAWTNASEAEDHRHHHQEAEKQLQEKCKIIHQERQRKPLDKKQLKELNEEVDALKAVCQREQEGAAWNQLLFSLNTTFGSAHAAFTAFQGISIRKASREKHAVYTTERQQAVADYAELLTRAINTYVDRHQSNDFTRA